MPSYTTHCYRTIVQATTLSAPYNFNYLQGGRLHVFTMRNNMDFDYRVPMILTSHRTLYSSRSKNFDYRVPMGLTSSLGVYSWRVGDLDYRVPMILTSTEVHPSRQCLVLQRIHSAHILRPAHKNQNKEHYTIYNTLS